MNIFPKSEYKILKLIYENPSIGLSELIKKAKVSAGTAKKRLDYLLSYGIIGEKKVVGGRRILMKNFYPDFSSEEGKNVFSLIESEKKQEFFKKNKNLIGPFKQLLKNVDKIEPKECRERVEKYFSLKAMVSGYEKAYKKVLAKQE